MGQHAERRVGSVIGGRWRVDALLGSGSMAAVYAVTHRNGVRAALKILHPTLCADPAVCERFLGEGYLTNSVKHAGIVRVLDDGVTDDGCVFLLMDLLEGVTLDALRERSGGRIELGPALDVADALMDVLEAVHEAGIIHRDLKPQNVFVCDDGAVKLLDFGVARVFDRSSSNVSMFGLVLGTPSFMSPEQALGARDQVDRRSDVWSLGATLFTAITGETVHLGPHVQAKLLAAATVQARSIALAKQDLPQPIAAAIDTALRFAKEDRWESVQAFRRALRDAREQVGLGRPSASARPPRRGTLALELAPESAEAPEPAEAAEAADAADASYPAASSTVKPERPVRSPPMGARRSGVAGWLVGLTLISVGIGGLALLARDGMAVRHADDATGAELPAATVGVGTSAPSSAPPPPAPRDPVDAPIDASAATGSLPKASMRTPPAARKAHLPPPPSSGRPILPRPATPPPAPPVEQAAPPPEPPPTEALPHGEERPPPPIPAPDPFSTPE